MEIKELLQNISKQDNLATQFPLYVVYDYEEHITPVEYGSENKYLHEGDLYTEEEMEETIEEWLDELREDEETTEEEIESRREDYDDEFEEVGVNEVRRFISVFLTRESAQEFIDSNYYHYRKPHIYVESAWRNWELQNLINKLFEEYKVQIPPFWEK